MSPINNIGVPDASDLIHSVDTTAIIAHIDEVKMNIKLALQSAPTEELQDLQQTLGKIRVLEDQVNAYVLDNKPIPQHVLDQLAAAFEIFYQQSDAINTPIAIGAGDLDFTSSINSELDKSELYNTQLAA
jgi:hypothetical protein